VRRIPIAVLQHVLLRVALALGVWFHPNCAVEPWGGFAGVPQADLKIRSSCPTASEIPASGFHAIFDATGTRSVLRNSKSIDNTQLIGSRKAKNKEAIGLTMNFKRFPEEKNRYILTKNLEEFQRINPSKSDTSNLAYQYDQALFDSKTVKLENWVYWKSDVSHYVVMTVPRKSLIAFGAAEDTGKNLLKLPVNNFLRLLKRDKLVELGLTCAREWNFPHMSENGAAFVENGRGDPDVSIFEYGSGTTAMAPILFLYDSQQRPVLFGLLGDAIETPFWPKGTGANHAIYLAQMQAMTLLAWRNGRGGEGGDGDGVTSDKQYAQEEVDELAARMMSKVLMLPIEGNKHGFNKDDYQNQVEGNYASIVKKSTKLEFF